MKFCKDCKWHLDEWYCYHTSFGVSPVNGHPHNKDVHLCRKRPSLCGPTAKWFEEKEKPIPLCVDCRWMEGQCCSCPQSLNPLTGELYANETFAFWSNATGSCFSTRADETRCGKYGKWFDKKEEHRPGELIHMTWDELCKGSPSPSPKKPSWLCRLICGRKK